MISPVIGFAPIWAPIVLSEGADFIFTLSISPAQYPANTVVSINWQNATQDVWTAATSGSSASWVVQSTATAAAQVPDGTPYRLYISYPDGAGSDDFLWYYGHARRTE